MISIRKNVTSFGRATAVTAALSILSLGGIASDASAQDKIKWKVQATFNTGWPGLGDPVARLAETLSTVTDGRITLKVFEPGKIVPPLEISPSISRGDLPAAYNYMAYDQGREMAWHELLATETGIKVYFADPHSPWQRGRNENTNGLLRQYLPKGTDLSIYSQQELDEIAWKLNTRPRKSLNFRCPAEIFMPESFDFHKYFAHVALGA